MKNLNIYKKLTFSFLMGIVLITGFTACEEYPDAYKATGGIPEVLYIRVPDVASADSLLDGAFLGNTICIVGNNLRSVHDVYFNDQKATLNTNFITDHTLIVSIPNGIPEEVTDNIYLLNAKGDKVGVPFKTKVPAPVVSTISCEYVPDGQIAILYGDYFIDDPNKPLAIAMAGNVQVTNILEVKKTQIRFEIPTGSLKGFVNVTTLYGTGRSKFQFRDDRGIITNFDSDYPITNSWGRAGRIESDPEYVLTGNYLKLTSSVTNPDANARDASYESNSLCHYWGSENGHGTNPIFNSDPKTSIFKFEAYVTKTWSSVPMQIIFAPTDSKNNALYSSLMPLPRGQWVPWVATGSYVTEGWVTVSIPIANFKYKANGSDAGEIPVAFEDLNIVLQSDGFTPVGTSCDAEILIDNIRVIPGE